MIGENLYRMFPVEGVWAGLLFLAAFPFSYPTLYLTHGVISHSGYTLRGVNRHKKRQGRIPKVELLPNGMVDKYPPVTEFQL